MSPERAGSFINKGGDQIVNSFTVVFGTRPGRFFDIPGVSWDDLTLREKEMWRREHGWHNAGEFTVTIPMTIARLRPVQRLLQKITTREK